MSMQTLTWDVDAVAVAAVAGNSDAYSLALAMQARQKALSPIDEDMFSCLKFLFYFILFFVLFCLVL